MRATILRRARRLAGPAAIVALALGAPGPMPAQTVVEVSGAGSSVSQGYGLAANVYGRRFDGWIGLGYLDGIRVGAFVRAPLREDTLRVGNDVLSLNYPTDIFGGGYGLLVQGVGLHRPRARTTVVGFAGAASASRSAPLFVASRPEQATGAVAVRHTVSPEVSLTGLALADDAIRIVPGVEWRAAPGRTHALVAGVGAGSPYVASSVALTQGIATLRAAYVWNPDRFRRSAVASLNPTELDGENVMLMLEPRDGLSIGIGRQRFVHDTGGPAPPERATGNSLIGGARLGETRLSAGLYASSSGGVDNLSSFVAIGRRFGGWLDAELFVLQSRPSTTSATTTPIVNLREQISPRLSLTQQVSFDAGRPRIQLGGSLRTALGEFGVDYQIVHQPFRPLNPFRSALALTARLQLGSYSTNLGTVIQPDGRVNYTASGSTYLYLGDFGMQPQQVGQRLQRYVVRGRVVDEEGNPVEGAALEVGSELVFTNSRGEFFLRTGRARALPLRVALDEFLLPGAWEVVRAPESLEAASEERAPTAEIVLRRVVSPPPPPAAPVEP